MSGAVNIGYCYYHWKFTVVVHVKQTLGGWEESGRLETRNGIFSTLASVFFSMNLCLFSVFKVRRMYVCLKVWGVDDKGEERRRWKKVPVWFGPALKQKHVLNQPLEELQGAGGVAHTPHTFLGSQCHFLLLLLGQAVFKPGALCATEVFWLMAQDWRSESLVFKETPP